MNTQGEVRFVLILFGVLAVVILGIIFVITSGPSTNIYPLPVPSSECNTLSYNGEDAIDLVFFANEENTQKYMDHLLETEPYNEFPNAFNVYYINQEVECEEYKGIAILCHSRELLQEAGACPHDFTIVLKEAGNLRSSAYQGVGSINTNHPMSVFTHELGHLFLSLDEEYLGGTPHINSINCKDACEEFTSSDGCYEGCSEGDLYRSIDNGVMRTLNTNEYGTHNENEMREWLTENTGQQPSTITGSAVAEEIAECFSNTYIYVKADTKTREVIEKQLLIGCYPQITSGPNTAALIKNENVVGGISYDPFLYTEAPGVQTEDINDRANGVYTDEPVVLALSEEASPDALQLFSEQGDLEMEIQLSDLGGIPCVI